MSINDFVKMQQKAPRNGVPSWFELYVPKMTDSQREDLMEALQNPEITNRTIARVLVDWGYAVSDNKVGHWRRKHVR